MLYENKSEIFCKSIFLNNLVSILRNDAKFNPEIRRKSLNKGIDYLTSIKNGLLFIRGEDVENCSIAFADFDLATRMFMDAKSLDEFYMKMAGGGENIKSFEEFYRNDFPNKIDGYIDILHKISCSANCSIKSVPKKQLNKTLDFLSKLGIEFHNYLMSFYYR